MVNSSPNHPSSRHKKQNFSGGQILPLLKLKSQTLVIDGDHCKGTDVYLGWEWEGERCISYTPAPQTLDRPQWHTRHYQNNNIYTTRCGFYPKTIGLQLNYVSIKFWFSKPEEAKYKWGISSCVGRYCADVKCNYSFTLTWTKKSLPIIRNSSLGLWNMNKIVSFNCFLVLLHRCWRRCGFWYDTCKVCLPHKL